MLAVNFLSPSGNERSFRGVRTGLGLAGIALRSTPLSESEPSSKLAALSTYIASPEMLFPPEEMSSSTFQVSSMARQ